MLYKCPAYMLAGVLAHYAAKDIAQWQAHPPIGDFWGSVVLACRSTEVLFGALAAYNWGVCYWNVNPFTQWFMLWGTVAVVRYLLQSAAVPLFTASFDQLGKMVGQLIPATIGALVFEFGAILWLVRRRDSERIHRLKDVGQLVGLVSLVVVAVALLVFASAGRRG
jgi:hypothetical protein